MIKYPKQPSIGEGFGVYAVQGDKTGSSTRYTPEVEYENVRLSDTLLQPLTVTLEHSRDALELMLFSLTCNSTKGHTPDRQKLIQKGLIISEKGENTVSVASDKACVNNLLTMLQKSKNKPLEYLQKTLPPTVSNIVSGMVLGFQNPSASELQHKIKVTGMQHVMVASGSNIGLVYYSSIGVLSPFLGLRRACLISLIAILGYILMIGVEPPVMRAGLMAVITVFSKFYLGKQVRPWWSLGLSGLILLVFFPEWISSISFQLSMASSLSILMWMPFFQRSSVLLTQLDFLAQDSLKNSAPLPLVGTIASVLLEAFQMTLAAQILTLPLALHYFGEVGSLLLIANTLLVPLVPVITLSGFSYLFVGGITSWLHFNLLHELWSLTVVMPTWLFIDGLSWVSQIQLPVWTVTEFPATAVVAWWAAAGLTYYGLKIMRHKILALTPKTTSSSATK